MSEIAVVGSDLTSNADLDRALAAITGLAQDGEHELLDEIARQSEAQSLYEMRRGHRQRERMYAMLRLHAEAALGVLSYEDRNVVPSQSRRASYRSLAAAYERGKLRDIASRLTKFSAWEVAWVVRMDGYTYVSGDALGADDEAIPWSKARVIARDKNIDPVSLPAYPGAHLAANERANEQARRMWRQRAALERLERIKATQKITAEAKSRGKHLGDAYGFLRKALQAFHEAQPELDEHERRSDDFNSLFYHLHKAEDTLGDLLRVT